MSTKAARNAAGGHVSQLHPEVFSRMQSVLKVLGGGGGPADRKRAAPYLEAAREWKASLPPASGFDLENYRALERIVTASLSGGTQRGEF